MIHPTLALEMTAAPSVAMFGSYFPAWLISLAAAVVATVLLRVIFVWIGLDDILRWRVLTYLSLVLLLTVVISALVFGR